MVLLLDRAEVSTVLLLANAPRRIALLCVQPTHATDSLLHTHENVKVFTMGLSCRGSDCITRNDQGLTSIGRCQALSRRRPPWPPSVLAPRSAAAGMGGMQMLLQMCVPQCA